MKRYWTTKDGQKVLFSKMTIDHLSNAKNLMERFAQNYLEIELTAAYSISSRVSGDMATFYIDQDIRSLERALDDIGDFLYETDENYVALCYWLDRKINQKGEPNGTLSCASESFGKSS